MSNSYNRMALASIKILEDMYKEDTLVILISASDTTEREAAAGLEKVGFISKLTQTYAYQITPLGLYVLGLLKAKTKEV